LLGNSDALLEQILLLAGRRPVLELQKPETLKATLLDAVAAIDAQRG